MEPPEDGNISNFNVQELAGLLRHLEVNEHAVSTCLAKQIDGQTLCHMDTEKWTKQLGIKKSTPVFFTMQYFITQSQQPIY